MSILRVQKSDVIAVALVIAGALAYAASFPPLEIAPLGWMAPVLWLLAVRDRPYRKRFWLMFGAGYVGTMLVVHWLTALFSTLALILWVIPATYFALWGLATGIFQQQPGRVATGAILTREPLWLRMTWPAVAWVGIEYFRCEIAPLAFSFGGLGYSQTNLAGFGIASVVGVYGISFFMVFVAAGLIELWDTRRPLARVGASVAFVAIGIGSMIAPAAMEGRSAAQIGFALLQQLSQDDDIGGHEKLPPLDSNGDQLDLIVWPELTFTSDPRLRQSSWFLEMMRMESRQAQWGLIFGGIDFFTADKSLNGPYYNSAFFLGPKGNILDTAGKNQPVQLLADGLPAPDIKVMEMSAGDGPGQKEIRAGVGICYDGCFQKFSRLMVSRGADFLVFPTMNLESWGVIQHLQHQRMFQMRAAEMGRTVLAAAVSGPTFAAAPDGAVGSEVAEFHKSESITAPILAPVSTLFNIGGWLLGPICLAGFLTGVSIMLILKLKRRAEYRSLSGGRPGLQASIP